MERARCRKVTAVFTSWYCRADPAKRMCSSERIMRSAEMGTPEVEMTFSSADSGTGSAGAGESAVIRLAAWLPMSDKGMQLTSSCLRGRIRWRRNREWDRVLLGVPGYRRLPSLQTSRQIHSFHFRVFHLLIHFQRELPELPQRLE